jgi:cobalt/nickel transport system permease protein
MRFSEEHKWWIYKIPKEISITFEGIQVVLKLTLKVINSVSIVLLIISTTTFERLVKSFSFFKVPGIFLLTLTMSFKYIFILSQTIEETYCALKMRWWNRGALKDAEEIVTSRIGYLFRKSWEKYELAYQSMTARGFSGSVNFYYFEKINFKDYSFLAITAIIILSLILINIKYA